MKTLEMRPVKAGEGTGRAREGDGAGTVLLWCGIAAAVLYAAMIALVPARWPAYDSASQTVSELAAVGAPTRELWVYLGGAYSVLAAAFGIGILLSPGTSRRLRTVGWVFVTHGVLGVFYPPMHLRGVPPTPTDALHVAFGTATVALMMVAMVAGARTFGTRFRRFSFAALAVVIGFGFLMGIDAPRLAANLPTPWLGVWERVMIAAFLLWMATLSVGLARGATRAVRPV